MGESLKPSLIHGSKLSWCFPTCINFRKFQTREDVSSLNRSRKATYEVREGMFEYATLILIGALNFHQTQLSLRIRWILSLPHCYHWFGRSTARNDWLCPHHLIPPTTHRRWWGYLPYLPQFPLCFAAPKTRNPERGVIETKRCSSSTRFRPK